MIIYIQSLRSQLCVHTQYTHVRHNTETLVGQRRFKKKSGSSEFLVPFVSLGPGPTPTEVWLSLVLSLSIASYLYNAVCRSQWPRGLRSRSAAAPLLRLWVRIPPGTWSVVSVVCCQVEVSATS